MIEVRQTEGMQLKGGQVRSLWDGGKAVIVLILHLPPAYLFICEPNMMIIPYCVSPIF